MSDLTMQFYFNAPLYTIPHADLCKGVLRPLVHAIFHMAHLLLQPESYKKPMLFYMCVYLQSEADLLKIELLSLRISNESVPVFSPTRAVNTLFK